MCGIVGILGSDPRQVAEGLRQATEAQTHRGPDAQGREVLPLADQWLGLGHRRLAILDLSDAGLQPMRHEPTGNWIIFNGEIYNFQALKRELQSQGERFVGHSDTEMLVAALSRWGPDALERLEGMFALAFVDVAARRLLLARDPLGIKPLYLYEDGGNLAFASEVRALIATGLVPARLDRRGVTSLLAYGAVQHPLSLFRGIRSLPPGHWQCFELRAGGWTSRGSKAYWDYPRQAHPATAGEATTRVRELLDTAVHDHLVAEVPVGVFLSSGLDSTLLAGLAARHSPAMQSFTVGFDQTPDQSELRLAAETAQLFGLRHTEIHLSAANVEPAVAKWLEAVDQPSMDGFNVFVISQAVRAQGIKVALSGLGGDELFGGYPSFRQVPRLHRALRWTGALPTPARRGLAYLATLGRSQAALIAKDSMRGSWKRGARNDKSRRFIVSRSTLGLHVVYHFFKITS